MIRELYVFRSLAGMLIRKFSVKGKATSHQKSRA